MVVSNRAAVIRRRFIELGYRIRRTAGDWHAFLPTGNSWLSVNDKGTVYACLSTGHAVALPSIFVDQWLSSSSDEPEPFVQRATRILEAHDFTRRLYPDSTTGHVNSSSPRYAGDQPWLGRETAFALLQPREDGCLMTITVGGHPDSAHRIPSELVDIILEEQPKEAQ